MTEKWQPIEKYKKGKAVFYYPPEYDQWGKKKLAETVQTEKWHSRKPTHFILLPPAPELNFTKGEECSKSST